MLDKAKRFHLVGIGGIGMSGVARLLIDRGLEVSGSDIRNNAQIEELRSLGARIFLEHSEVHIEGADVLSRSSAIDGHNPEVVAARKRGIPVLKRAELLALLISGKKSICVSGSHGKTTTASMVATVLKDGGLCPTVVIGGIVEDLGGNVRVDSGDWYVAEADESDGTLLCFTPTYSVVTNIDKEHMDYYKDISAVEKSFSDFIEKTADCCFYCYDDERLRTIARARRTPRMVGFGLQKNARGFYPKSIQATKDGSSFQCVHKGRLLGSVKLRIPGMHNISNALAAVGIGCEMGLDFSVISEALFKFAGVRRRFEVKGCVNDILIIDDYAHHPTEIKATLSAAALYKRRTVVIFQPHRYTRTLHLLDEFAQAFDDADCLILTDIYPANEKPIEGVSSELIYKKIIKRGNNVYLVHDKEKIVENVLGVVKEGDLIITLGAGDINKISQELKEALNARQLSEM